AFGVDSLGGADLLGHGDAQLVDEPERRVLVDDDVRRERQLLAVCDEGFEALDEEDDVDRTVLQLAVSAVGRSGWHQVWHARVGRQALPDTSASAARAEAGPIDEPH